MTTETTAEAVQQTLAEYERLAISAGEPVQIDPPEFWSGLSIQEWSPVWAGDEPPKYARATVHRDGVPTTVYVSWEESLPAVDDWRALWLRKPMKLFGAYTLRTVLRRAYRDVIGDRHEPDERDDAPAADAVVKVDRDWLVELSDMENEDEVQQFHRDAKAARAVSVELERAIRQRLVAVRAARITEPITKLTKLVEGGIATPKPLPPTPADLAAALAKRPAPAPQKPRSKNGRRPQKPKPRGPQAAA